MPLDALLSLIGGGVRLFSLQKDLTPEERDVFSRHAELEYFGEDLPNTAAIISLMDLVVSIDSSMVHIAGALGMSVWVLLATVPDWRWMLDRDDNPWYPTARLFRQRRFGDWASLKEPMAAALAGFAANGRITR